MNNNKETIASFVRVPRVQRTPFFFGWFADEIERKKKHQNNRMHCFQAKKMNWISKGEKKNCI